MLTVIIALIQLEKLQNLVSRKQSAITTFNCLLSNKSTQKEPSKALFIFLNTSRC